MRWNKPKRLTPGVSQEGAAPITIDAVQKQFIRRFRQFFSEASRYSRSDHRFRSVSAQDPASPHADGREKRAADPQSCRCEQSRGSWAAPVVPHRSDGSRLYGNWRTTVARAVLPGRHQHKQHVREPQPTRAISTQFVKPSRTLVILVVGRSERDLSTAASPSLQLFACVSSEPASCFAASHSSARCWSSSGSRAASDRASSPRMSARRP
jgi:hypothetical protein